MDNILLDAQVGLDTEGEMVGVIHRPQAESPAIRSKQLVAALVLASSALCHARTEIETNFEPNGLPVIIRDWEDKIDNLVNSIR